MSAGIPTDYAGAERLGADGNAMLALARAKWHTLTGTQQRALVDAKKISGTYRICVRSLATSRAMFDQGLVRRTNKWAPLTGLGIMVREAGTLTRETPSDQSQI